MKCNAARAKSAIKQPRCVSRELQAKMIGLLYCHLNDFCYLLNINKVVIQALPITFMSRDVFSTPFSLPASQLMCFSPSGRLNKFPWLLLAILSYMNIFFSFWHPIENQLNSLYQIVALLDFSNYNSFMLLDIKLSRLLMQLLFLSLVPLAVKYSTITNVTQKHSF